MDAVQRQHAVLGRGAFEHAQQRATHGQRQHDLDFLRGQIPGLPAVFQGMVRLYRRFQLFHSENILHICTVPQGGSLKTEMPFSGFFCAFFAHYPPASHSTFPGSAQ